MTLASNLRASLFRIRTIPGRLGLRPAQAWIRETRHPFGTGDIDSSQSETPITESGGYSPKIRQINSQELALGQLPSGSVLIGPITPELGATLTRLHADALNAGDTLQLRIAGAGLDGIYDLKKLSADRPLRYMLTVVSVTNVTGI